MSFRRRLTAFFLLIVVIPMVAVGVLVVEVTEESRRGKADASLAPALETAAALAAEQRRDAERAARRAAADPALGEALASGDAAAVRTAAGRLARATGARSLVVRGPGGQELAEVGAERAIAVSTVTVTGPGGELGGVAASTVTARRLLAEVQRATGIPGAVLSASGRPIASSVQVSGLSVPPEGRAADIDAAGQEMRVATTDLPGDGGARIALLAPVAEGGFFDSRPAVAAMLGVFFALAVVLVLLVRRVLQRQVAEMLAAAQRIGGGDFSRKVPEQGRDEMAELAREFNKMSDRLSAQMEELKRQRVEIERSVRRIGEAFASGLDRDALFDVVIESALSACRADYGLIALGGGAGGEAEGGNPTEQLRACALAAERRAAAGEAVAESGVGCHALAAPLRRLGEGGEAAGVMTIVRAGEPFDHGEREVFIYLAGQVAASMENITLHQQVSEQAVTDELTGLANTRAFRKALARESARAQRFDHAMSLIMLDIDDFKQVNDTLGHPQGDEVLRMIGRVLREESRATDAPARYGGEEFAVALPETDVDGAMELAERIRGRIASERLRRLDGQGEMAVTASLGVACAHGPIEPDDLLAAADAALYAAKRGGKDRVVLAPDEGGPGGDGSPTGRRQTTKGRKGERRT